MHVRYNMLVIDCNMPVTCVILHRGNSKIDSRPFFAQRSKGRLCFVLLLHGDEVLGVELISLHPTASSASLDQI